MMATTPDTEPTSAPDRPVSLDRAGEPRRTIMAASREWLARNRVHLVLWSLLAAYLGLQAPIQRSLANGTGEPVALVMDLTQARSVSGVSFRDPMVTRVDGQEVYLLTAWLPPGESVIPSDRQSTGLVLVDDRGSALLFEAITVSLSSTSPDHRLEERELVASTFSTYIARGALGAGAYRIGVGYSTASGEVGVVLTDQYLMRTPNTLHLLGYRPAAPDPFGDMLLRLSLAEGSITQVPMGYDFFALEETTGSGEVSYRLLGYAFPLAGDVPLERYRKAIVLRDEESRFSVLPADTVVRNDVGDFFASLGLRLEASAFAVTIDLDALEPGVYRLGILYTAGGVPPVYTLTDSYLRLTHAGLVLFSVEGVH